ncbi:MAG: urease accessory protein UreE [Deltaproteobacteria bacterium]|jgi:urease accessory protein|nr:urease accessory protein UreE [Deltaproteobacteria bacterium]
MLTLNENLGPLARNEKLPSLSLDLAGRSKARQRAFLSDGREAHLFLERGRILKSGDILCGPDGEKAVVIAKPEPVILARADSWARLVRAAYHLGNRHTPVELGELTVKFAPEPVLEEMVRFLGLVTEHLNAPFEPESGAYRSSEDALHYHSRGRNNGHPGRSGRLD